MPFYTLHFPSYHNLSKARCFVFAFAVALSRPPFTSFFYCFASFAEVTAGPADCEAQAHFKHVPGSTYIHHPEVCRPCWKDSFKSPVSILMQQMLFEMRQKDRIRMKVQSC